MSRVNFPTELLKQYELFLKVKSKHDADGATSPLIPYFTEQGIDFDADALDADDASDAHLEFLQHEKDAEEDMQTRNHLFDPAFSEHRDCVQFLKKLYRGNEQKLGEWGVEVNNNKRIHYPEDFFGRRLAVGLFFDKYQTYAPGTSPLETFLAENQIDLAANNSDATDAVTAHESAEDHNTLKEELRAERDALLDPIVEHLRGIGEFLVGLYADNPNKAGKWGYVIDNSPQADKVRTFKLSAGEIKTLKDVALNSEVVNIGQVPVSIKPHNHPDATPIIINPSQSFKVIRGYGDMDVNNLSPAAAGSIKATQNR